MFSLDELLRPHGDRHPKANVSSESLKFTSQQKLLDHHRCQLLHWDAQCQPVERQRREHLKRVFGRSHIAAWDDLWPMVEVINRVEPRQNLACVFSVCADGTSLAPANVQLVPQDLFNNLGMLAVLIEFARLAQIKEQQALAWHAKYGQCFFAKPGASVAKIMDEINQRQDGLESTVLGQLLWLQADAISFLPEPGQPNKGWADAWTFFWGIQQLPPHLRDQLDPCQLLIDRLKPATAAK
jgi:hypothetical protein